MESALFTDLYQLTMGLGYWKSGIAERGAAFYLSFRRAPFHSGFTVACGLGLVVEYLGRLRFSSLELRYLEGLRGKDGTPLFEARFLEYLEGLRFGCDVDAVPEGTVVFPHEPLVRVQGPILQAQLVESALLNLINYSSLVATKAARVCHASQGDPVIEFGLRRAQGPDGALTAARASYIGGTTSTSNAEAGFKYGIPLSGTHAHSWVQAFASEREAFERYADAMPGNCVLLVDTYDSLQGVGRAIQAGKKLRERGHELAGIRLDSGDLAYLSKEARRMLNEAGFTETMIVASNDLDEHIIMSLKQQGAAIDTWGVGTRLVTGYDHSALGGVYKLSAIRGANGRWRPKLKVSEQAVKTTIPGLAQVRRFRTETEFVGDAIYDCSRPVPSHFTIVDPLDSTRRKRFSPRLSSQDLLVPVMRAGRLVCQNPTLTEIRQRVQEQLAMLHPGVKRLTSPHQYPAGLALGLHHMKTRMVLRARK